jgi:iron complex outermembrane recepter protein
MLHRSSALIAAIWGAAAIPSTFAQQVGSPEQGDRTIETIIVTAQKREQQLQDVPIVVTAISGQLLQDTGVQDIRDLTIVAPGLTVTSTSTEASTTARIRGIGTVGDNPGLESSVGVVVDGVYRPRNGVGFGDLGELARIEVLKGPQGTLFGKNTSAGVINIVTQEPQFEFASDLELTAGNEGALEGEASLTGPLTERLAGRLYAATRERDGFLDVRRGGGPRGEEEDVDRDFYTVRGQALFQPSNDLELRVIADYTERREHCCAAVQLISGPTAAILSAMEPGSIALPARPFERIAYSNRHTDQDIDDGGISAQLDWDLPMGATLTSISAWRDWEIVNAQDADFTTVDILYRDPDGFHSTQFEQASQELRLSGETQRWDWLVGAFYAREDLTGRFQLVVGNDWQEYVSRLATANTNPNLLAQFGAIFPGGLGYRDTYDQKSDNWALFTNNTYKVTDGLELTVGLRYTDESKELDAHYVNEHGGAGCQRVRDFAAANPAIYTSPAAPAIFGLGCVAYQDPIFNDLRAEQSLDESEWSGTAKLAYRFSERLMTYASYARGYKAGGFNLDRERIGNIALNPAVPGGVAPQLDTSFGRELVDSYEIGAKSQWLNDTLLLNAALFHQQFEDFQLNTFTGLQFEVTSLPEVQSQGVDLDMIWFTPWEALSLQGGVTFAQTEIEEFGAALTTFAPNRENDRLSFAPRWSASLAATYEQPLAQDFLLRGSLGAKYTSEYNTGSNLDPRKTQDALTLINLRLGFGAADESWMVEAWSQNLTDEEYVQVAFDATHQANTIDAFLGAPRTYGLTARFRF